MMLKSTFILSFLLATTLWVTGQITVTNATFPAAGDTLKTATDLSPDGIVMTGPGGPQAWDFSTLNPSTRLVTVFRPAAEGSAFANFPGAELVTLSDVGAEVYFDVSATAFSILGISGEGLGGGFPIEADFRYTPPLAEREAPLNFFDIDNYNSSATIALPTSAIPGAIFDSLGIPTGLFDSIRVRISVNRLTAVDGFGTLTIPGGTYDVLRQKRTDYTSTGVDVHTILGWIDIGTILGGTDLFPADTTISFHFLSDTEKEPIAIVTTDSTGMTAAQIDYKDNGVTSAVDPVSPKAILLTVYPNPVSDEVTFEFANKFTGPYTLRLYNNNGQLQLTRRISTEREVISIGSITPGKYVYQILDEKGHLAGTGELIKL